MISLMDSSGNLALYAGNAAFTALIEFFECPVSVEDILILNIYWDYSIFYLWFKLKEVLNSFKS